MPISIAAISLRIPCLMVGHSLIALLYAFAQRYSSWMYLWDKLQQTMFFVSSEGQS
jgi:hypothetical protein